MTVPLDMTQVIIDQLKDCQQEARKARERRDHVDERLVEVNRRRDRLLVSRQRATARIQGIAQSRTRLRQELKTALEE